jgi:hypothetical protein
MFREIMAIRRIPDDDVAFDNMSIRESKWRQITKKICMQLVGKVFFLLGGFAQAANFPFRKKSITLLTCCINSYFLFVHRNCRIFLRKI